MGNGLTTILQQLRSLRPQLAEQFGVSAIFVFGSHARGEAGPNSDLDLIVEFAAGARPTLFSLARLDRTLEAALGVKVDVIPRDSLNPRLEPYIRTEQIAA